MVGQLESMGFLAAAHHNTHFLYVSSTNVPVESQMYPVIAIENWHLDDTGAMNVLAHVAAAEQFSAPIPRPTAPVLDPFRKYFAVPAASVVEHKYDVPPARAASPLDPFYKHDIPAAAVVASVPVVPPAVVPPPACPDNLSK